MRKVFAAYKKLMGALYSLIRTCIAVILIVMVCVTFMEVIRRYIFGLSCCGQKSSSASFWLQPPSLAVPQPIAPARWPA